jgi:hypothetical protein
MALAVDWPKLERNTSGQPLTTIRRAGRWPIAFLTGGTPEKSCSRVEWRWHDSVRRSFGVTINPDESARLERQGVDMLVRVFGMVESDARELLRSAGGNVDSAIDAWLEAGEQLVQRGQPGDPISRTERLGLAQRWARLRR